MQSKGKNRFSQILRSERESRQMTLEQMATFLGTTKQVLSRYERGERNPKLITAAMFAQKLGIPISAFQEDIDTSNVKLIGQRTLSSEEKEKLELSEMILKHADAIELLEKLPPDQYGQAMNFLRFLSENADNQ